MILNWFSIELDESTPRVKTAAKIFSKILYENPGLSSSLILGGYDHVDGFSVYAIPLGGSSIRRKYCLAGSGSTFI